MKSFQKPSLFIVLIAALLLGFGCERETVQPAAPDFSGMKTDLGDTTMTEAEFKALYDRVGEVRMTHAADPSQPQAVWFYQNQRYQLTYSPVVTVGVAGAHYTASTNTLAAGATVGGFYVDPAVFNQVFSGLSQRIRLIIQPSWLDLTQVTIVLEDQGNATYNGLFNFASREYLFLGVGAAGNSSCGAIALGRVYGKVANLNTTFQNIFAGQVGYALVLACHQGALAGSLGFSYTGVAIP
jgi:hypothetical protein